MQPTALLALTIGALSAAAAAQTEAATQRPLPEAGAVLTKLEAKAGPPDARAAIRSIVAKGKVGAKGIGGGTFTEIHLGDRAKYSVEFAAFGGMTQGTDGEMSWSTDPAMGIIVKRGAKQAAVQRMFALGRRAPWSELYTKAETVGTVEIDDREHFELRMTPEHGKPETWFVDAQTYDLARVDLGLPDPMGGPDMPCKFLFTDWRDVAGVRFPFTKTQKIGTYEIVFDYASIDANTEVKPEQVAPSKEILAAAEDVTKQTPQAPTQPGEFGTEKVAERHAVTIRLKVEKAKIGQTLAVVLPEVLAHLGKAGATPNGPPFSRYHGVEGDTIDLEAGMPVAKPVKGEGRVKAATLPGGTIATTWHIGPFEKLNESYEALEKWIGEQELESRGAPWEVYWTDPGIEPDPKKWRTQVIWPVGAGK